MSAADSGLKSRITEDMKTALRAGDKTRLGAVRLIVAAIQQREIDTRERLDDQAVIAVLDKMAKQRRESLEHYRAAERDDLADKEQFELDVIQSYLPRAFSETEIDRLIEIAVTSIGAAGIKDMGKVMAKLKPELQGRADMAAISARVKARLTN